MRFFGLTTMALVFTAPMLVAQVPGSAQPMVPAQPANNLQAHLVHWERAMMGVETLAASMRRIEKDKTFNSTKTYKGYAQYRKVGSGPKAHDKFMLEFRPENNMQEIAEKIVSTGTYMYVYQPRQKEIRYREIPKRQDGQPENNFLTFLLGMKANQAQLRYAMSLVKEDEHYVYVSVIPRNEKDKADFTRARVVLMKKNYLPRQLWFEQPNGSEVTWDISAIQAGVAVDNKLFDPPQPPKGWKLTQDVTTTAPTRTTPRVIRSTEGS